MSNDIFIREVNEELRQDRVKALWIRYGAIAMGIAVLIVLAVGAYVLWERYRAGLAAADGDRLIAASTLLAENKKDEALVILQGLASNGTGAYPDLARMRIAETTQADDPATSIARFDEVAADGSVSQSLRDMAAIRAAYILVDTGSLADVRQRVERLTGDGEALRYPAREAIGLSAWKAGDIDTAEPLFTQLQDDLGTPRGIKQRASLILELIAASTTVPAPAGETPPAPAGQTPETPDEQTPPASSAPATTDTPSANAPTAPAVSQTAPTPVPPELPAVAPQPPA